jgi:hypothetical protein
MLGSGEVSEECETVIATVWTDIHLWWFCVTVMQTTGLLQSTL